MPETKPVTPEFEYLLEQIVKTLASHYDANDLKQGIKYGAMLGDRAFTLTFERSPELDAQANGKDMD